MSNTDDITRDLTEAEQGGPFCHAAFWSPGEDPLYDLEWRCTLAPGHKGDIHVAHGLGGVYITHEGASA